MSYQAFMYKGNESKIFEENELKQAEADGWFDNPGDAIKAEAELQSQEEADFEAELQKEEADKTKTAASGATTLEKKE